MSSILNSWSGSANLIDGLQLLLDLTIKSVVLLTAAWVTTACLRRASAASRHWVWSVAVIGLLALPILSTALPGWRVDLLPSLGQTPQPEQSVRAAAPSMLLESDSEMSSSQSELTTLAARSDARPASSSANSKSGSVSPVPGWITWLLAVPQFFQSINWPAAAMGIWLVGLCLIVTRLVAGTFRIRRVANRASRVTEAAWVSLTNHVATKLRLRSSVGLLKSEQVALPMTLGAWRSVVMLPAEADEWPVECRRIVLLHELAHVKRRDCLTQNLAQLACAIYWFNPLVWLVARQLRIERELACDDEVLEAGAKASDYAGHLVEIARSFSAGRDLSPVAVGMACSQLESRVRSILDPGARRRSLNRKSAALIGIGAACLVLSLALVKPWGKATASSNRQAAVLQAIENPENKPNEAQALSANPQTDQRLSPNPQTNEAEEAHAGEATESGSNDAKDNPLDKSDDHSEGQGNAQSKGQSGELTVDQIIEMKMHDVTPEFIESMRQAGFDKLAPRDLAQFKIHGVTPEYIESLRKLGYDKLSAGQLTRLKIHGLDETYLKQMQSWMGGKPSVDELLQVKIHGVSPEYARAMKSLGYDNIPINKLTQMKIHGVNEQELKEMRDLGLDKPTVDQLIRLRIHGVTVDYVKKLRAAGLKNVSINQMIEMKIHGLDSILLKEKK